MTKKKDKGIRMLPNGKIQAFRRVKRRYYSEVFEKHEKQKAKDWYDAIRTDVLRALKRSGKLPAARGSFAKDVDDEYLPLLSGNPRLQRERRAQLGFWSTKFGARPRHNITALDIQRALAELAAAGYAYYTIKHLRAGLLAFYKALDKDTDFANPVLETAMPLKKPEPEPRGLPLPTAMAILAAVSSQGGVFGKGDQTKPHGMRGGRYEASKTQARIHVMAYTGMRHEELRRYTTKDWRRDTHELIIHAAKGSDVRVVPLAPDAEHWLKELESRDAIGDFDNSPIARAWRRALVKVGLAPPLPRGQRRKPAPGAPKKRGGRARGRTGLIRPYDLRHTFGTAVYQQTGDLSTTQSLMGHKDIRQTQRYAKNAVPEVQRAAIAKFSAAISEAKPDEKVAE